jgi:hypothetical protein
MPNGGENLDITFSNIRHAIFQAAEKEVIVLLHLHLRNPIMVGKKKVKDVQFYTEVMTDAASVRAAAAARLCRPRARLCFALALSAVPRSLHARATVSEAPRAREPRGTRGDSWPCVSRVRRTRNAAPSPHLPNDHAPPPADGGRAAERVRPGRARGGGARARAHEAHQQRVQALHAQDAGRVGHGLAATQA